MARLREKKQSGFRLLVIDDSDELSSSVARLFSLDGHEVKTAAKIDDGVALARSWRPHCVLVDYFLDGGRLGEEVIEAIRLFDSAMQIVLMTGYAGEVPPREYLHRLDIQGYHDKSSGPDELLLWVDSALKSWRRLDLLARREHATRQVLEASAAIHRIQPLESLFELALHHSQALVGRLGDDGVIITFDEPGASVCAAAGDGLRGCSYLQLPTSLRTLASRAVDSKELLVEAGWLALPFVAGGSRGCIVTRTSDGLEDILEALRLLATQIAVALENLRLFSLATVDSLTQLSSRSHFFERLVETMKLAARNGAQLSVIVGDADHFKRINDTQGHAAGDAVLAQIGEQIRRAKRDTDVAGRIGGEEVSVLTPQTNSAGAAVLAERMRAEIASAAVVQGDIILRVTVSVGYAGVERFELPAGLQQRLSSEHWRELALRLVELADEAMYRAKNSGRNRVEGTCVDVLQALIERAEELTAAPCPQLLECSP